MHTITVEGHEPGDYLHPDQKLEIIDEETGKKYELYVRSNVRAASDSGEISLFIPLAAIQELRADKEYCVMTLSQAGSKGQEDQRKKRLAGLDIEVFR